jgi:imidazolonepropionase-like amidohydrolase
MKTLRFYFLLMIILCIGLLTCDSGFPSRCTAGKPIVLINATLIDGKGAEPIKDAYLIISDDKIIEAGGMNKLTVPAGSCILDVRGKTILPGLIDCSVYAGFSAERLKAWAKAGITTVRDMDTETGGKYTWDELGQVLYEQGGFEKIKRNLDLDLVQKLRSDPDSTRLLFVGPLLSAPNGRSMVSIHQPPDYLTINSVEDAGKKTAVLFDLGADAIHIWDSGFGGVLSDAEFTEIVRSAHARSKRVAVSAWYPSQFKRGLERGVDDFNSITNLNISNDLIVKMAQAKSYLVPALSAWESVLKTDYVLDNMKRYVAAGGKVAMGDGVGNPYLPIGMPIREFELMAEAGMTPMQIIIASTKNAALVCNLGDKLGTLEPGKIADVIVIDGNPLADIHNLKNVAYVFKDGKLIRKPN